MESVGRLSPFDVLSAALCMSDLIFFHSSSLSSALPSVKNTRLPVIWMSLSLIFLGSVCSYIISSKSVHLPFSPLSLVYCFLDLTSTWHVFCCCFVYSLECRFHRREGFFFQGMFPEFRMVLLLKDALSDWGSSSGVDVLLTFVKPYSCSLALKIKKCCVMVELGCSTHQTRFTNKNIWRL